MKNSGIEVKVGIPPYVLMLFQMVYFEQDWSEIDLKGGASYKINVWRGIYHFHLRLPQKVTTKAKILQQSFQLS